MPLSEEELRMLEQMERALVEEDPKFASTLRGTTMQQSARRKAILAGIGFTAGVCALMGGAITALWWLGVIGFVIMLGSATMALSAMKPVEKGVPDDIAEAEGGRRPHQGQSEHPSGFGVIDGGRKQSAKRPKSPKRPRGSSKPKPSGSFMERMEERWRRRREEGGY